jgi:cytochrome c oxidase subunit IV
MEHTAHSHPITSPKVYAGVLAALLVLTVITVTAAGIDFGAYNTVIALIIATIKASLVALFFMHLRHDKFDAVVFLGGVFFLGVFLIFTLFDINSRQTILPSNLKEPVKEFPGAPLNKPVRPSTGSAVVAEPAK